MGGRMVLPPEGKLEMNDAATRKRRTGLIALLAALLCALALALSAVPLFAEGDDAAATEETTVEEAASEDEDTEAEDDESAIEVDETEAVAEGSEDGTDGSDGGDGSGLALAEAETADDDGDDEEETTSGTTVTTADELTAALSGASEGDTITLGANITLDSSLTISTPVTLDLGGYTLTIPGALTVNNAYGVVITNGTIATSATSGNVIYVTGGSISELSNLTIDGNSDCTGIYLYGMSASIGTISGCNIQNVTRGIDTYKCNPSSVTDPCIGTIENTSITASGDGIHLYMSSIGTISGCTITSGDSAIAAIGNTGDVGYSTTVTVKDSTLSGAYGVYLYDNSWGSGSGIQQVTLDGCKVTGTTAAAYAMNYANNDSVTTALVVTDCSTNIRAYIDQYASGNHYYYYNTVDEAKSAQSYSVVELDLEHTESEAVQKNVVEATCTEDGSYDSVVYCSVCGDELSRETVTVEAKGHSYEAKYTRDATCTTAGFTNYVCSVCGNVKTVAIPATGHSWDVEWTWTDTGEEDEDGNPIYTAVAEFTCSACGETETVDAEVSYEVTEVLNYAHLYDVYYTATATASDGTVATDTCKLPARVARLFFYEDSLDSDSVYSYYVADPDRATGAVYDGDTLSYEYVMETYVKPYIDENYDEDEICSYVVYLGDEEMGEGDYATVGAAQTTFNVVIYTVHSWDVEWTWTDTGEEDEDGNPIYEASCTATCTRCGETETVEAEDVTVTYTVGESNPWYTYTCNIDYTATATLSDGTEVSGTYTLKARVMRTYYYQDTVDSDDLGFDYGTTIRASRAVYDGDEITYESVMEDVESKISDHVDSYTCYEVYYAGEDNENGTDDDVLLTEGFSTTADGWTQFYVVAYSDHNYGEGVVTDPTCTEGGYTTYTCTVCGETKTGDETEATGHTEGEAVKENEVEATCTEDGSYDSVVYCTVCGEELSRETVTVDATGHDYDYENITWTWADDYSSATATVVCNNDSSHVLTVDAAVTSETTDATCTEDGSTVYTATITDGDGNKYTDTQAVTIEAAGHTEGEAVVENEVEATCTEEGSYDSVVYCTVCGEELSRETLTVEAEEEAAAEEEASAEEEAEPEEESSDDEDLAQTGDGTAAAAAGVAAMGAIALAAGIAATKRRRA